MSKANISKYLRGWRARLNISQSDAAMCLGIPRYTYMTWEGNRQECRHPVTVLLLAWYIEGCPASHDPLDRRSPLPTIKEKYISHSAPLALFSPL